MFLFYAVNLMFIPLCIMLVGWWFTKGHPKKVNYILGYRSKWSMKSIKTWQYAHMYFGKLWLSIGFIMTFMTLVTLFVYRKSTDESLENIFMIMVVIEIVLLLLPIIPTEIKLREKFNAVGEDKQ